MPHNRTRIWVGLAIAAVTIPAVGQYFYGSHDKDVQAPFDTGSSHWNAARSDGPSLALRQTNRDYQGELNRALARNATYQDPLPPEEANPFADDNPIFDVDPMADYRNDPINQTPDPTRALRPGQPDPADEMAPDEPADTTDQEAADEPADAAPAPAGLSDRTVYSMAVDNMNPEQRDDFVRSWAVMTVDQRAAVLDEFRAEFQNSK